MKATKHEQMYKRIERHGQQLITLFSLPTTTDPIKLCKQLRRAELKLNQAFTRACNEDYNTEPTENQVKTYLAKILGPEAARIILNHDPRGYSLKINLNPDERLHRDWGGYGIIAPDLTGE